MTRERTSINGGRYDDRIEPPAMDRPLLLLYRNGILGRD